MSKGFLLNATGVGFEPAGRRILTDVSVSVDGNEIVALIGPNGSGKTTLVRILLGVLSPTTGSVERRRGLKIGYVPQKMVIESSLPLSVRRFLKFGVERGYDRALRVRQATLDQAVLDEVGICDFLEAGMHEVSGGELQRVMLARALLRNPDLLVLDEPVQGVDVTGQAEIYDLITRIRDERKCGILMVSHDLHLVMASTDRVICLNRHVCCAGRPESVARDPAFQTIFGADVAARLAVYHHDHDHVHDARGKPVPIVKPAPTRNRGRGQHHA